MQETNTLCPRKKQKILKQPKWSTDREMNEENVVCVCVKKKEVNSAIGNNMDSP